MQVHWRGKGTISSLLSLAAGASIALFLHRSPHPKVQMGRKDANPPQLVLQQGHPRGVVSMALSPDNTLLITAGEADEVKLWDLRTGELRRSFAVEENEENERAGLAFLPDGTPIVSCTHAGKAGIYDLASGRLLRALDQAHAVDEIVFSADGSMFALSEGDAGFSLWDYRTGRRLRAISAHVKDGEGTIMAFSPDGSLFAFAAGDASGNGDIEIRKVSDGSPVMTLSSTSVHAIAFSPDGKTLAATYGGFVQATPTVALWDLAQRKVVKRLVGKEEEYDLFSLAFAPDGRRIAALDGQGCLTVWDITTEAAVPNGGMEKLDSFRTLGPGAHLGATADRDGGMGVYNLETGQLLRRLPGQPYTWETARITADGASLLLGGSLTDPKGNTRNALLSWDLLSGNWKDLRVSAGSGIERFAVNAHGTQAVVSNRDEGVKVWDLQQAKPIRSHSTGKNRVLALALSPTDPTAVLVGELPSEHPSRMREVSREHPTFEDSPFLEMIDTRTGQTIRTLKGPIGPVYGVQYTADGSHFATLCEGRTLILWNARTGLEEHRIATAVATPECFALSRDGSLAAIAYDDVPTQVVETHTGHVVGSLSRPHSSSDPSTQRIALSPQGDWVAISEDDGSLRTWNVRTGQSKQIDAANHTLAWVGFTPQGTRLASLDKQGFLRLWDVPTGQLLLTFQMVGPQDWIVYTPDGYYEGSANVDNFLRWRVGTEILPADRYRAQFYRPDLVQTRLSGKPQPERYAQLLGQEATLRRRLAADQHTPTPPSKQPVEETNPTAAALKEALSAYGESPEKVYAQVKAQLAAGADPNVQGKWGTSPLMFLAACGDIKGVRALLNHKANVNLVDVYGSTALLDAVSSEQQEMIPLLLAAGADLKDKQGNSLLKLRGDRAALTAALSRVLTFVPTPLGEPRINFESEPTAWMLLYLGADPNVRNPEGETPLMQAQTPYLMKALLAKGADPNVRNQQGSPLIIDLSGRGQVAPLQLLLNAKADPNAADPDGWTGLMYAAQNGYTAVAKLLLDHGANPNPAIKDGRTPLTLALSADYLEMAQALLAHGARVNVKDDTGWTPLMYAVNRKDATAVKILLAKGADIHVRNAKKQSLLQQITAQDPQDSFGVARILKQAGARQ